MELSRNKQHFVIMTIIYDELVDFVMGKGQFVRDARDLVVEMTDTPYEEVDPYILNCISAAMNHYGDIVNVFSPLLKDWKWERLPLLTQSILLMSYAHYKYVEKVDKKIVINTAVELAKTYTEEKQAKFINAILDEALK